MTPARLENCCGKQEKTFVRKIAAMGDEELVGLHKKLAKEKPTSNRGKRPWWVVERQICFVALELMDRGFHQENTWVK